MRVKLKRNGWHKKLQIYTLGLKHLELPNLCPYFWLTIVCLFIVPFVFIFRWGAEPCGVASVASNGSSIM
jgi:hypothetical protein